MYWYYITKEHSIIDEKRTEIISKKFINDFLNNDYNILYFFIQNNNSSKLKEKAEFRIKNEIKYILNIKKYFYDYYE